MKKIIIFLPFILSVFEVSGKIVELQNLRDMKNFIKDKKTLVVFDLDNTVMEPKGENAPGSNQWFDAMLQYEQRNGRNFSDALEVVLPRYVKAQSILEVQPVEKDTSKVIQQLQHAGNPVMALTSRRDPIREYTMRQLKSIGVSFDKSALSKREHRITDCPFPAEFERGILFAGRNDKGKLLLSYLHKLPTFKNISQIVMVDDKGKYLHMAEKALKGTGIEFIGLRYGFLDEKVKNFSLQGQVSKSWWDQVTLLAKMIILRILPVFA